MVENEPRGRGRPPRRRPRARPLEIADGQVGTYLKKSQRRRFLKRAQTSVQYLTP